MAAVYAGILILILSLPVPCLSEDPSKASPPASTEGEEKLAGDERGSAMPLGETVLGVEVAKALSLAAIIEQVSDKKIVYAGERHTDFEDHLVQLEIIKGLLKKNGKIAIGMEMFQKPSQGALDDYIGGKISEKEFLKASDYFRRWGFDYHLYKDILRFARDEKIPVVALNMRKEIVEKVSKGGIDALSEEEKNELPGDMDMTDEDYKKRLKKAFEAHTDSETMSFENFYQSQIIWDETMAQSIDDYLKQEPDRQMVVMAGSGHLTHGSGIPRRTFSRNKLDYAIVLSDVPVEKDIADFVLYPKEEKAPASPKLGVLLKDEDGRANIIGFAEMSSAEKAGLEKGDVIVALDDDKIGGSDDMKIFFFYKKKGDTVTVSLLRKRFLFGERLLKFEVTL
ncbi:MAG TPA: ChaN family lipoprotein [Thermodesulfovibrionales bacterium]|nr:ChaN family lipoprotein [Thermodesulfovibrionales bacterium]